MKFSKWRFPPKMKWQNQAIVTTKTTSDNSFVLPISFNSIFLVQASNRQLFNFVILVKYAFSPNIQFYNTGITPELSSLKRVRPNVSTKVDENIYKRSEETFFMMDHPRPFFHLFSSFQTNITILQQRNVKNVHPVYGAGIWTHDLRNMSLLP